jgi:hypothetical protein
MPSIKNTTMGGANPTASQSFASSANIDTTEIVNENRQLKQKIDQMEHERNLHTTVIINKNLFGDLAQRIDDKTVKRIYLDFDENYTATKIRVEV